VVLGRHHGLGKVPVEVRPEILEHDFEARVVLAVRIVQRRLFDGLVVGADDHDRLLDASLHHLMERVAENGLSADFATQLTR